MAMTLDSEGTSGYVYGIDQETGTIIWSFQTVEEDFWGNPELNSGGGIWFPPGIDIETGMTFWATGNPAPFPGSKDYPNASSRPGPNLYSNTMLAFDCHTIPGVVRADAKVGPPLTDWAERAYIAGRFPIHRSI